MHGSNSTHEVEEHAAAPTIRQVYSPAWAWPSRIGPKKWFPDAFVFALVGLIIVFAAGLLAGVGVRNLIKYFGDGFWGPDSVHDADGDDQSSEDLSSPHPLPPVHRLIKRLAKNSAHPARRRRLRRLFFFDDHVAAQLGARL